MIQESGINSPNFYGVAAIGLVFDENRRFWKKSAPCVY
jgi:hypothetical protein